MTDRVIGVTLKGNASQLQQTFATGSMAASNFGAVVEKAMGQAKAANRDYSSSAKGAVSALEEVRGMVKGVAAGLSIMKLIDTADEWGQYASRVQMATRTAEEFGHAQERLAKSAAVTYRSLAETREGFINMSPPLRELGLSLDQSIDAIDTFSGLLVTNSASTEKGKSAIGALSTAMQKGKLEADGWGTILSTMPSIVDLLAQSMGRSAAEIRRLGAEGKLTAKDLAKALVEGNAEVIKQVELMPTTVRDAFGRLTTVATEFLGKNNEASGATATLAAGIDLLAQNFELLAAAVGIVSAVYASRFVGAQALAAQKLWATAGAATAQTRATLALSAAISGSSRAAVIGYGAMATAARTASAAMALAGGLPGLVTLALVAGTVAWMNWGSAADRATQSINAAKRPLKELEEEFSKLNATQQRGMVLSLEKELEDQEGKVKESMASIRKEIQTLFLQGGMVGAGAPIEEFAASFNEIMRSSANAAEKSDLLASALERLRGSVPDKVVKALQEMIQRLAESGENVDDLKVKLASLIDRAKDLSAVSDAFKGMAEADFSKLISGLTESLDVIGMSAQQAEVYKAKLRGASDEQAALAGFVAGMADAAKKLEKATADQDAKAVQGARNLLSELAAQEIQLRVNSAYAAEYKALLALGVSEGVASQGADTAGELAGLKAQEEVLKRIKTVQDNIAANTKPTKKSAGSKKQDEDERLLKQMRERLALLGKETEYEKLLANISSGAVKFRKGPSEEEAKRLAKQLDDEQRQIDLEKTLKSLREEQSVTQREFMRELDAFGKGDWANGVIEALSSVEERYRQIIRDRQNSPHGLSQDELKAIQESLHEELVMVRDHYAQLKELQGDWSLGASSALQNYADQAANLFDSVGNLATSMFKGMEDALASFVTTGKLDFKSLADSIIQDMIRIAIQQSITGPLASAFGNLFNPLSGVSAGENFSMGSLGGSGGFTPTSPLMPLSSGGYTGDGGRYEPAGIVHKGEGVLNQDEIRALGGESGFNELRRALRGPGHALGGMAGSPSLPLRPKQPAQGGDLQVVINNYGGNKVEAKEETSRGPDGQVLRRLMINVLNEQLGSPTTSTGRVMASTWKVKART
ncbi:phage tail tape measure protein [Alcaligenes aquatilis]|uniref:phage tail tape measure protein n=1 Tax=Alcaligenes aquatilis TaxID=323284 RepID=UPI000D52B9A5|nr:phage tail tape measure protein [Alcaligenes aquatilis]AWG34022.1 phage tail tape measure protein [Alcaligenes aquatilis]